MSDHAVNPAAQTISDLLAEINRMENLVAYYQGRILRKRIAIEEILQQVECAYDRAAQAKPLPVEPVKPPPRNKRLTSGHAVTVRLKEYLSEANGTEFRFHDVHRAFTLRWPDEPFTMTALRAALKGAIQRGVLRRVKRGRFAQTVKSVPIIDAVLDRK